MDGWMWFCVGVVLTAAASFSFRQSAQVAARVEKQVLEEKLEQYRQQDTALRKTIVDAYKEALERNPNDEIPSPPDFFKGQEEAIRSFEKNNEEWAKTLSGFKGERKNQLEAQQLALEAKATRLESKLRSLFDVLIGSFRETIDVLNRSNVFDGAIGYEVFEVKGLLMGVHTELRPYRSESILVMRITFPSGGKWDVYLRRSALDSLEYDGAGEAEVGIGGDKVAATISISESQYIFRPERPMKGWPDDVLTTRRGGVEYLQRVIKVLFQQEIGLT